MKVEVAVFLLACLVSMSQEVLATRKIVYFPCHLKMYNMGYPRPRPRSLTMCPFPCAADECCTGGYYYRRCPKLSSEGQRCEPPNKSNNYMFKCPCQDGMLCGEERRCQKL